MDKRQYAADKKSFEQAGKNLLRKVSYAEPDNLHEAQRSWREVEAVSTKPCPRSGPLSRYIPYIAASVAFLICLSGFYFWVDAQNGASISSALLADGTYSSSVSEIIIIERNDKLHLQDRSSILYNTEGISNSEEHVIKREATEYKGKGKGNKINQLIVPKGRKADITFSDGTAMHVNAGTRVFYPSVFGKDKREILVEGEVYLDVKPDPSRPFIVRADGFEVKVLGTQFNVCAHKEDASASVVLVNGQVEVSTDKNNKSVLHPDQMMEISHKGTNIKEVDVFEHICWKDNIMMLNDRRVGDTFARLSRYYGRTIRYDNEVEDISLSGKLDLRKDMEEVVNIICRSLSLKYEIDSNNDILILKQNAYGK